MASNGQSGAVSPQTLHGPPYPSKYAGLGLLPTKNVDIPVSAVLVSLFICSAAFNMTIFRRNRRRGHKFVLSSLFFGFSMARITANVLRIVWACYPRNVRLAIAAQIFANAGVIIVFLVNLILVQRVLRAYHPRLGWSTPARVVFRFFFASVPACLIMLIVVVVYSFYTLDQSAIDKTHDVQVVALTYFAVLAFLPIPTVGLCFIVPRRQRIEKFGAGSMRYKLFLIIFAACLLTLGAAFRAGVSYYRVPSAQPRWFHQKACFYSFNYVIELIVVFTYALSRFDKRFHIPDGSSAPGHYVNGVPVSDGRVLDEELPWSASGQTMTESAWNSQLQTKMKQEAAV
ncbi:family c-likeg- -coupled receptor [Trichoderma cornu-damae]|uniref:Family c-likeg- -coupled receptor n=1 Tax=Trichoderma cornu-damae TaxID=654480 RepID=A0A9P8QLL2_9HYPO|nr:family c-likeg- -coupled receptor [Trichoderma cornu-damae]